MSATRFILLLAVALTACSPKPKPVTAAAPVHCDGQPHQIVAHMSGGKVFTTFHCPDGSSEVGK